MVVRDPPDTGHGADIAGEQRDELIDGGAQRVPLVRPADDGQRIVGTLRYDGGDSAAQPEPRDVGAEPGRRRTVGQGDRHRCQRAVRIKREGPEATGHLVGATRGVEDHLQQLACEARFDRGHRLAPRHLERQETRGLGEPRSLGGRQVDERTFADE